MEHHCKGVEIHCNSDNKCTWNNGSTELRSSPVLAFGPWCWNSNITKFATVMARFATSVANIIIKTGELIRYDLFPVDDINTTLEGVEALALQVVDGG